MVVCPQSATLQKQLARPRPGFFRICAILLLGVAAPLFFSATSPAAQTQTPEWQMRVRKYAESQDWAAALWVVEQQIARSPQDLDLWAWRARILTWSGRLQEAEAQYLKILTISRKDPDMWLGLSSVYSRQGKNEEVLRALNIAVELDPKRADLHAARGRALHAERENAEARHEFQKALVLDPTSNEALLGIRSFEDEPKHELRSGQENDVFNFTGPNHAEWLSLTSRWTSRWSTSLAANTYQRGGVEAGKFVAGITTRVPRLAALTIGGATGHDNGVIPKSEAFFDVDRGWRSRGSNPVLGVEFDYGQHWYWYQAARILTLNGATILYFPRQWTLTVSGTGARSAFSGTGVEWRPSGVTRLGFPLTRRPGKGLSGNLFFAAGSESFAQVDQIGRFASQTYGGALRFQLTSKQDVAGYASYQKRTQGRRDTNFGFSYGIHF
jgi:tetratricopeptide (TPR) repeat protein